MITFNVFVGADLVLTKHDKSVRTLSNVIFIFNCVVFAFFCGSFIFQFFLFHLDLTQIVERDGDGNKQRGE